MPILKIVYNKIDNIYRSYYIFYIITITCLLKMKYTYIYFKSTSDNTEKSPTYVVNSTGELLNKLQEITTLENYKKIIVMEIMENNTSTMAMHYYFNKDCSKLVHIINGEETSTINTISIKENCFPLLLKKNIS